MTKRQTQTIKARDLRVGDEIVSPRCVVKDVFLPNPKAHPSSPKSKVQLFFESKGSGMYRPESVVTIYKRKTKRAAA